jgi:excisionase family DNA binding protein
MGSGGLGPSFFTGNTASPVDHAMRRGSLELLSIPQVCQELGMGKSWAYRRLKIGEIPSIKLGSSIKVARADLEEYLHNSRYKPPAENDINSSTVPVEDLGE